MDLEQYKHVLSCHRPDHEGPFEPEVAEALAAMQNAPELAEWYAEEIAFDRTFKTSLAGFEAPPMEEIIGSARKSRRWPRMLAIAAAVVLVGGIGFLSYTRHYNQQMQEMPGFRDAMAYFSAGGFFMLDKMDEDFPALQAFMADQNGKTGPDLEEAFASATPMGCRIVNWKDHAVSLYCFVNDEQQIIHAYLLESSALTNEERSDIQRLTTHYNLQTAGWLDDDTAYLLVGSEADVEVQPFLVSSLSPWRMAQIIRP